MIVNVLLRLDKKQRCILASIKPKFTYKLDFYVEHYNPCIVVYHRDYPGEVWGKLSINVPYIGCRFVLDNEFVVKNYSENESWYEEALDPKYFQPTGQHVKLTHVTCPIYTLTPLFIKDQLELLYNPRTDIFEADTPLWSLYNKYVEKK